MKLPMYGLFVLVVSAAGAREYDVRVESGPYDRIDTPVYADLRLPGAPEAFDVCVVSEGKAYPAAPEKLNDEFVRVWWILESLPAHQSTLYAIHLLENFSTARYRWTVEDGWAATLMYGDKPVLRYMRVPYDPAAIESTKKPFHHLFAPDGTRLLTKGIGGLYSHHRGLFYGYNKIEVDGEMLDTWHAAKGEHQVHHEVIRSVSGACMGGHSVRIDWNDRTGQPFAQETRTIRAFIQPSRMNGHRLIDFESELQSSRGDIRLGGDRQHAGVQFRAAQEVADHASSTRFIRPDLWSGLPADKEINDDRHKELPWNAMRFMLDNRQYTVVYLCDPARPKGAEFSERSYGRFGEFIPLTLSENNPVRLRYRLWISDDPDITRERIEAKYHDFAHPPTVTLIE